MGTGSAVQDHPRTLSVWTNEVDTVVAYDALDAQQVVAEQIGCTLEEYQRDYGDEYYRQLSPSAVIKICDDCGYRDKPPVAKSAAEWIEEGRGFLASTEC